jgi:transposase
MKKIVFTEEQRQELRKLARNSRKAHERIKAIALLDVAQGMPRSLVARVLGVERRSVGRWVQEYLTEGATAFSIERGRGRRARVRAEEVAQHLRQAPSHFGIGRTRWTLGTLKEVVPSLRGLTESGVWRALVRLGYRYKRGQPVVHSPDPQYREKRGLWWKP